MKTHLKTSSIFDSSRPCASGGAAVDAEFPEANMSRWFGEADLRCAPIGLPELSEVDVVRHFTNLSYSSHGVDNGPYPLGSCTMKYNPKRNDELARLDGFAFAHPHQPHETLQGIWDFMVELQQFIAEMTGMDYVSLHGAAGAHGELSGLLIMRRHFQEKNEKRPIILIPDSAHGTNPASAAMAGFECKIIPTTREGLMDLAAMERHLDKNVAGLMLTNPSTLGLFEENIQIIAEKLHRNGSLLYYDGANFNALMGIVRPGDMGFDVIHINTHKTLSTPHGGGGPGAAGPVGVKAFLEPHLPIPVIQSLNGRAQPVYDRPRSIGKIKAFYGHVEVLLRAYCYILTNGPAGLRLATENAVLNANYIQHRLSELLPPLFKQRGMHECLLSGGSLKVNAFDFVKRLIDFGVHPPTLVGAGCVHFAEEYNTAMLIEPTETESRASLDDMAEQFLKVAREAAVAPYLIETAPHTTAVAKVIKDQAAYITLLEGSA